MPKCTLFSIQCFIFQGQRSQGLTGLSMAPCEHSRGAVCIFIAPSSLLSPGLINHYISLHAWGDICIIYYYIIILQSIGDRPFVHCREVVLISEGTECMLQSVGGKQFVRSTEVVLFSECPLSEVPLHVCHHHSCRYTCCHYRCIV